MAYSGPRPHRSGGASVNEVLSRTVDEILFSFRASAIRAVGEAVKSGMATIATDAELKKMLEDLGAERIPANMRQEMWQTVGDAARRSLISAYAGRKYRRPVGSYRTDNRYADGKLAGALASKDMYEATAFGLNFLNRQLLDDEARQWRRLNFGAGEGGQEGDLSAPKQFPVTGLGFAIGLQPDVRPAFGMPLGFFLGHPHSTDRVGLDPFFAAAPDVTQITRGIAARNFLDAPMRRIAESIQPGLLNMFTQYRSTVPKTVNRTVFPH